MFASEGVGFFLGNLFRLDGGTPLYDEADERMGGSVLEETRCFAQSRDLFEGRGWGVDHP